MFSLAVRCPTANSPTCVRALQEALRERKTLKTSILYQLCIQPAFSSMEDLYIAVKQAWNTRGPFERADSKMAKFYYKTGAPGTSLSDPAQQVLVEAHIFICL